MLRAPLQTKFGGGRSTGFGLIYDDEASQKQFEPKHRLVRVSLVAPGMSWAQHLTSCALPVRSRHQGREDQPKEQEGEEEQAEEGPRYLEEEGW